ncbi:sensor histidine kinase [Flavobacterium terrae]|uniref:histidine kinase n=1 Tax=Flavobacterium terrae TaxID=415425 RepID=A0A1M6F2U4_9FLAO|nr:ATP-binding protein [Flavobacterium terrae]SHI92017.1 Histidine kinase-, DNA gyrase B-, and HSP90-like ATPase [Flavobacterium terrae]
MYSIAFGIIISLLFVLLLVLFCILIIKLYINKVKNYTKLIYQKDIDFQKALNQTIIETQEQVLNNIAQDLHDDVGQQLTYINFQIENLKLDNDAFKSSLEPLSESVGNLSHSIRSVSHSLSNQLIVQQDLLKAITNEVKRLQKNTKIKIESNIEETSRKEYSINEKIVVYRIFQEIINNCFKHAKASKISININTLPNFSMTISDNGKGFDNAKITNKATLGIHNMKNRAAIINYHFDIKTSIGEGTTIVLSEKV